MDLGKTGALNFLSLVQVKATLWHAIRVATTNAAQVAAEPAALRQQTWILKRLPDGIGPNNFSWQEFFRFQGYTYPVDIANLREQNLKF